MLDAAAAAAVTATADRPPVERRRRLSLAALAVTNQKVPRAYSPVVIAGVVRVADFVLLSLVGLAIYFGYVVPLSGFRWEYVAAIFGMTAAAVVCFQAADIYEVQVFRGQLRQMTRMISAWAFVFLLFIGASFFAKLGGEVSRLWLSAFFFVGLATLIGRTAVPAGDGSRLGAATAGSTAAPSSSVPTRTARSWSRRSRPRTIRTRYSRRVRRPQRFPRARHLRRQSEARQGRRHRRIRPPHPRRPRAVRAADFGGDAHSAKC